MLLPLTEEIFLSFRAVSRHERDLGMFVDYVKFPSYIGYLDGKPLGMGGVIAFSEGVGGFWSSLSEYASHYPVYTVKTLKRMLWVCLRELGRQMPLHRAQSFAYDNVNSIRLNMMLGFEYEGTMRRFYPDGSDAHLMAMLL